ncbi:hypothetical protein BB558_005903 [Smittium angustum]|uniref:Uncharacterized protein n=1 Tax=Smittium angustum TaxID=133377 RepID=A0A2U1IZ72_SMIAN|nr:hypothetical protein BB558_005903 [Smittium angustum]
MINPTFVFDLLGYQSISDIFVFAQNPNVALVSRSFYEVSQNTNVQARYFLFGPRKTENFKIGDFYRRRKKLKEKEDLAVILADKMDIHIGWSFSIYDRNFLYYWPKCLKKLIYMNRLVAVDEAGNKRTSIENHSSKKRKIEEKYDVEPTVDLR